MGWSLENFLKQFVFLDWITKEQATFIKDEMNVPTCSLFIKLDHKITCDENKIEALEDKNVELQKKLEIADSRLIAWSLINEGLHEKLNIAEDALEDWLKWEDKQIQKEGAYVGAEIRGLIAQGKEALAAIKDA